MIEVKINPQRVLTEDQMNVFNAMIDQGVFDIQWGKCTLNFANGSLQNIVKEEMVWRKQ